MAKGREVSSSILGQGGLKNVCGRKEPSDYISFLRAVERQRLHTLNTLDTKGRTTQQHSLQTPYTLELNICPFPVLFFFFFLLFSVLFFIPYERIKCPGWGRRFHSLCPDPFFPSSCSSFLLLFPWFLGTDACRPCNNYRMEERGRNEGIGKDGEKWP